MEEPREVMVKKEAVEIKEFECQTVIEGIATIFYQEDASKVDYSLGTTNQYCMQPSFSSFLPFLYPPLYYPPPYFTLPL